MSISTLSNRWLNRLYKIIAVILVLFAVMISALRLFLPYAENFREDLENYINERYQSEVSIASLSMGWHKLGPVLVANDVGLIRNEAVVFTIEKIDIKLDFWRSLRGQKFITDNFILDGAKLEISPALLNQDTSASTTKNSSTSIQNNAPVLQGLADLFFEQIGRFSLRDAQLVLKQEGQSRTFSISKLTWMNLEQRHIAKADVIIDGVTSNNIKLMLDVTGKDSSNTNGQLYLEASNLNITPWLDKVFVLENENTHSSLNFSAWLTIKNGSAQQLQLTFDDNEITWQDPLSSSSTLQKFAWQGGQLQFSNLHSPKSLKINSTELMFNLNQQAWQPLTFAFERNTSGFSSYLSKFELDGISTVLPLFSADKELNHTVKHLALQAKVKDLYLQSRQGELDIVASFSQLSNQYVNNIPGIENASGSFVFSKNQLQVLLNAKDGALDFSEHFIAPIPYKLLAAKVDVAISDQGWQLVSDSIELQSDEIHLKADIGLDVPKNGDANMALLASITQGYAQKAHHYFPLTSMSDNLVGYLTSGLRSGNIEQAAVLYNGAFSNFPFEDKSGIFIVDAELTNNVFSFDSDWPSIINFDANLNFTNNSMMITGRKGTLSGLDVTGVKVGIASLADEQLLTVDLTLSNVNPLFVTDLMNKSPLKNSVGSTLNQLVISQPINGFFNLVLPLNDTEAVIAKGEINFKDNQVHLQTPDMTFTELSGVLAFKNDEITASSLKLKWLGLPLTLDVASEDKDNYFNTAIHLNADWQAKDWSPFVPQPLQNYLAGNFHWQGDVLINNHHDGGFSYDFTMNSVLQDMALSIPKPYQKTSQQQLPLNITVTGQRNQSTINLDLGKELMFHGLLNHAESANSIENPVYFSRAHLVLGNEKMLLPMDGFHITTGLEYADFSEWQPFIKAIADSIDEVKSKHTDAASLIANRTTLNNRPLLAQPERIRGSIGKLAVLKQELTNVSFNFIDKKEWWLLQLNAKEARSEIKFYPDWLLQGIDINADFLYLTTNKTESDATEANTEKNKTIANNDLEQNELAKNKMIFATVPPMRVSCDSCKVGNIDFGKLSFSIKRTANNMIELLDFDAKRGKTSLKASGLWQLDPLKSITKVKGVLVADDVEAEMESLEFASTIKDSGIELEFAFDWQGGPQQFTMAGLNGAISGELDDGYLAEVSDKGARVFSLLSLGSLARKLKLDFRDIFSDGMFYSSIKGDFAIKNGILYTDNTRMNGAAGNLTIKGNTQLSTGILDYRMSYRPDLTSSLPVLAWIATLNPVVFLTGLAINEVITSTVISEFNFELTGNAETPILKEVNRKTKDVSVGKSSPPQILDDNPTKIINKGQADG